MKLKICTCKHKITTKDALRVVRFKDEHLDALYFTCPKCKSTGILRKTQTKPKLENTKGVA